MRCLEKNPADRWQNADELLHTLEAMTTPSTGTMPVRTAARRSPRLAVAGVVTALVLLGITTWWWTRSRGEQVGTALDPSIVAVLPFRVSGAEPAYAEGMVDLLAAKLTGEGGPRAADAQSVLSAWRRAARDGELPRPEALALARRLGAGRLLSGSIVGTPNGLVLNASLFDTARERVQAQADVQGPADSLTRLVDRLTAELLARGAGEGEQRVADLSSISLRALRAYLEGQASYRRGSYHEAMLQYEQAVDADSSFALAALGLAKSAWWIGELDRRNRGLLLAFKQGGRLGSRDRALLDVTAASAEFPDPASSAVWMTASERAVAAVPDSPEAWFELGDALFHQGDELGIKGAQERAAAAFQRAVVLDSGFAAPLEHLVELAVVRGDTAEIRQWARLYFAVDSTGNLVDFMRWRVAGALQDTAALRALRERFEQVDRQSLLRIVGTAQLDGINLEDAERAAEVLRERAGTRNERSEALRFSYSLALNRGRPGQVKSFAEQLVGVEDQPRNLPWWRVGDALFWDSDPARATQAVRELAPSADAPLATDSARRALQYGDICAVSTWRLVHHDLRAAERGLAKLNNATPARDSPETIADIEVCRLALAAGVAHYLQRSDATVAIDRLDSLLLTGPRAAQQGNLFLAQLREMRGDLRGALAALRRREYHWGGGYLRLSTFLREEGRLAELNGDRDGAIRAYQHYLALRSDPEPSLKPQVDQVRAALARLVGEAAR